MYSFFIGCDISKSTIDIAYIQQGIPNYLGRFRNDISGFKSMISNLKKYGPEDLSSWFICFENTGIYSKALLEWLHSQQIPCKEENAFAIKKSLGIKRGKDDKADAVAICRYAFEKRDSIKPSQLSNPLIINLKKLLSRRELLVRQKQSIYLSLSEQKKTLDPDIKKLFEKQNQDLIHLITQSIKEVEVAIKELMHKNEEIQTNYSLAQSVVGIGPVIAAYLIAYTNNFNSFTNSRKFATYIGISPFPNQSGIKNGRTRVSHMANKKLKALFSNGTLAALMADPGLKNYYQRKINEGKQKGIVINALKNKLVHRVFAVVKRKQPYVKLNYT